MRVALKVQVAAVLAGGVALAGGAIGTPAVQPPVPDPVPVVHGVSPLARAASDVAALVHVRVVGRADAYDDRLGPGTRYDLEVLRVYAGALKTGERVSVRQFGGDLPSGKSMGASDVLQLEPDTEYFLPLKRSAYFWSALGDDLALRRAATRTGDAAAVAGSGRLVTAVTLAGIDDADESILDRGDALAGAPRGAAPMTFGEAAAAIATLVAAEGVSIGGAVGSPELPPGVTWSGRTLDIAAAPAGVTP
ncbi:MAG: hypothetical protein IT376_06255 [Polyangiaceae bacterium]|nr:hypothetical protein [Polyangiaceae bacterium]